MITVIAQSARIARTISYALGADFEYNGYYANEKYFITWTYGPVSYTHLTLPTNSRV